ncbi:hypothetical protein YPPY53_1864, partial [Yersinia pestis PY-53]
MWVILKVNKIVKAITPFKVNHIYHHPYPNANDYYLYKTLIISFAIELCNVTTLLVF